MSHRVHLQQIPLLPTPFPLSLPRYFMPAPSQFPFLPSSLVHYYSILAVKWTKGDEWMHQRASNFLVAIAGNQPTKSSLYPGSSNSQKTGGNHVRAQRIRAISSRGRNEERRKRNVSWDSTMNVQKEGRDLWQWGLERDEKWSYGSESLHIPRNHSRYDDLVSLTRVIEAYITLKFLA